MLRWFFLGGLLAVGCASGEPPGGSSYGGASIYADEDGETAGTPAQDEDAWELAWREEVAPGTTHLLDAATDFAVVLSASRDGGVSVQRFDADATGVWKVDLPELAGAAAIALGVGVDGSVAVAGPPADGTGGVVVAYVREGEPQWTAPMAAGDAVLDVAVHGKGKVAVVAEHARASAVETVFEIYGGDGSVLQREVFTQPQSARAVVAQDEGFVLLGDGGNHGWADLQTWVRSYSRQGFLEFVDVIEVGYTGAWTRHNEYDGANVWIGGIVNEDLSCVLPVSPWAEQDMKESPLPIPIAMTPDDRIVMIEDGVVIVQSERGEPRRYTVGEGTAVEVAAGPHNRDAVFVLSEGPDPMEAHLHRLSL